MSEFFIDQLKKHTNNSPSPVLQHDTDGCDRCPRTPRLLVVRLNFSELVSSGRSILRIRGGGLVQNFCELCFCACIHVTCVVVCTQKAPSATLYGMQRQRIDRPCLASLTTSLLMSTHRCSRAAIRPGSLQAKAALTSCQVSAKSTARTKCTLARTQMGTR